MKATGIPPHVTLLTKFKKLESQQRELLESFQRTSDDLCNNLVEVIEERALMNNHVTPGSLKTSIEQSLERAGVSRLFQRMTTFVESPRVLNQPTVQE